MRLLCLLTSLCPPLTPLQIAPPVVGEQQITVVARSVHPTACCPNCHRRSRSIHSSYVRRVADLSWAGALVCLELHGRRFRCRHPDCPRRTFRERFSELAPYSRRTSRLRIRLERLGLALGGRPAARVARALDLAPWGVSRMSLLRLVHALPLPPRPTPRVLGVDDWAWRRGHRYGTLLADLERRCPIDLLPDRTAQTFAAWLREHPGVEIICRDRGGAYAEGARQGAPDAVQVADRFHLVKNLGDQLEALLMRHDAVLRQVAAFVASSRKLQGTPEVEGAVDLQHHTHIVTLPVSAPPPAPLPTMLDAPLPCRLTREQQRRQECRARRLVRYERAQDLQAQGLSIRVIAETLGLARHTVRRLIRAEQFPERHLPTPRFSQLAHYQPYLRERWEAGEHNAAQLWREIRAQGFMGAPVMVRRCLSQWRAGPCHPGRRSHAEERQQSGRPPVVRTFSPRHTRWLLLREAKGTGEALLAAEGDEPQKAGNAERSAEDLDAEERAYLDRLRTSCPPIAAAQQLVQDFLAALRAGDLEGLETWLAAVAQSQLKELQSFAYGLRRDRDAVEAAFRLPWSSGQMEGQINRLKTLKRQMYGRSSFALLRQRVLQVV